jgi:hypothetical protein
MAVRYAEVVRGVNRPLLVELTSNLADTSGVVVPIPVWAMVFMADRRKMRINIFFIMMYLLRRFRLVLCL